MKKTLLLIAAFALSAGICNAETIKATNTKIQYTGRTHTDEAAGAVSFDWSATTIKVKFSGKSLSLKCSDTHRDFFNVWIDKAPSAQKDGVFIVESDTLLTLFKGKKGVHEITLQKRTEAEQGCLTAYEFTTDGTFLQPTPAKTRLIEFVGDSYTCGYGTEAPSATSPFLPEEENPTLTYADILGRYFDAETVHISHSGRGIIRNYGDFNQHENMVKLYGQTFDQYSEEAWTPSYTPDIVVIYLGTNDFSTGKQPTLSSWSENYIALLKKIRSFHGEVPILCVASKADPMLGQWVKLAVEKSGLDNVHATQIDASAHNNTSDLGASWHPNYNGHRKVASIMAPYISTITAWPMPAKVLQ